MTEISIYRKDARVKIPYHATPGAAGLDLCSNEPPFILAPNEYRTVSTGVVVAIPEGYVGLMCPRSGLAARNGVTLLNAPGIIDCDYRGELQAIVVNQGQEDFHVNTGDRIAQLVLTPYLKVDTVHCVSDVEELPKTKRGTGGLGSTGIN